MGRTHLTHPARVLLVTIGVELPALVDRRAVLRADSTRGVLQFQVLANRHRWPPGHYAAPWLQVGYVRLEDEGQ